MKKKPLHSKLKAIVFDLDDTLFDTYGQLVMQAHKEACVAMLNKGLPASCLEEVMDKRLKLFKDNPREDVNILLCQEYGLEDNKIVRAGFDAFFRRKVKEISLFPDSMKTLDSLDENYKKFLVTTGDYKTQNQKVSLLGINDKFEKIFYVDVGSGFSKKDAFEQILNQYNLKPYQVLSVGNRLDSEIRSAKELGMYTVLMKHGEFVHMTPSDNYEVPDYEIYKISGLLDPEIGLIPVDKVIIV